MSVSHFEVASYHKLTDVSKRKR